MHWKGVRFSASSLLEVAGFLLLLEEKRNWGLVRLEMRRPKMTRIGMMTEKYREQIPFHDEELPSSW